MMSHSIIQNKFTCKTVKITFKINYSISFQMKTVKFSVILISLLFLSIDVSGQFGLRMKYNNNNFSDWEAAVNDRFNTDEKLYSPGYEVGLDYWFKLKKRRIEFMPEISYALASTKYNNAILTETKFTSYNFNFHTQIYALDLEADCDCPTFSKQGPSINKGLFFHFTPGVSYYNASTTFEQATDPALTDAKGIAFKAGIGLGMDIGVSNLLTITPIISYYFNMGMNWENLALTGAQLTDVSTNPRQLQFTLRLGFRPDYGRGRRR